MPENTETGNAGNAATRRKRYLRLPSQEKIIALTPTKVQMLRYLAELRFLSLPQLAKLCCPSERQDLSEKSARRHMRELFDAGLVNVLPVSRAALAPSGAPNDASLLYGSAPNVYAPTVLGLKLLWEAGIIGEQIKHSSPTYGPRNSLFLAHELAVRDVRVWLEGCARASSGEQKLLTWKDGQDAAIDLGQDSTPRWVRPDAWFVYQVRPAPDEVSKPTVLVAFVEVDRGTERGSTRWEAKIEMYTALFESGRLQDATGYQNARILIFTSDYRRIIHLSHIIAGESVTNFLKNYWLTDYTASPSSELTSPIWCQPGSIDQRPLLPASLAVKKDKKPVPQEEGNETLFFSCCL